MAFRPLGDRVVIRRVEEATKTKGGIFIPDNVKEKPQEGEVVAVGPGAHGDDFAFLRLFLDVVGDEDPALGLGCFFDASNDDAVAQGTKGHCWNLQGARCRPVSGC